MPSGRNDHSPQPDPSRDRAVPGTARPTLRTKMSWHSADDQEVTEAFVAALDALDERAHSLRMILGDPHVYGLADPATLRHQIDTDDAAALVIRSVLDDGTRQDAP